MEPTILDCGHEDEEPDVAHSSDPSGLDAVCFRCCWMAECREEERELMDNDVKTLSELHVGVLTKDNDRLRSAIEEAIQRLKHEPHRGRAAPWCVSCGVPWPCRDRSVADDLELALRGPQQDENTD